jgi:hypothetical protein
MVVFITVLSTVTFAMRIVNINVESEVQADASAGGKWS